MQQPEPEKITAELTAAELDAVLRKRIEQQKIETSRTAFKNMSADEQRRHLRNLGVSLL